jgi:hypothetical protein
MSYNYAPNPSASPIYPLNTVFLSQRDLGLQIPINFVTAPGVSLTSACFAKQIYEDEAFGICLSNLLAVGFRRLELDVYWDQRRSLWSFCPVSVPSSAPSSSSPSAPKTSSSSSSPSALTAAAAPTGKLSARQASTVSGVSSSITTNNNASLGSPTSRGSILPSFISPTVAANETLINLGPYTCTTTINLSSFLSQLQDYIQKTETTLAAHLIYLIVNMHASKSTMLSSPQPTHLPDLSNTLGNLISSMLSVYLYTPQNLRSDRANLNGSWYTVPERYRPSSEYYSTSINVNDIFSTESGWPSESYIEFSLSKRLLLQWGIIDPQMADYNFTADDGLVFPKDYIQKSQNEVMSDASGNLTSGCFAFNSTESLSIASLNSSWAAAAEISGFDLATAYSKNLTSALNLTSKLTACGISPILNSSLLDSTADVDFTPYSNFSQSAIWSWAPNEPSNYSSETKDALFNCATSNLDLGGRWRVSDCSQKYSAACRAIDQPYNWTITSYQISYSYASQACSEPYVFTAPRTALENSYLTKTMQAAAKDLDGRGVWVDFNSLDVKGCWVTGGPNVRCPYAIGNDALERQTILIPTIAGIIVLVFAALTIFVKIAGHRRVRKRTRTRATNGFIYEGIPS